MRRPPCPCDALVRFGLPPLLVAGLVGLLGANPAAAQSVPAVAEPLAHEPESGGAGAGADTQHRGAEAPAPAAPMQPLDAAISLDPGATCLERERLVRRIARWMQRDAIDARIRVHVRGGDAPDEVAFRIELVGAPVEDDEDAHERAERRIEDAPADCGQLHSALALSIALAIDATLLDDDRQALELPENEEIFEPAAPPYFRFAAALLGSVSSGVLTDDLGLGAAARVEVGFVPWLDLRLGAAYSYVGDQRVQAIDGTFDVQLAYGRIDMCAVAGVIDRLRLMGCASGLLGSYRTQGSGFSRGSRQQTRIWSAGGLTLEVQLEVTAWLAAAVALDLVLPFERRIIRVAAPDGTAAGTRELTAAGAIVAAGPVFRLF